MNGKAHVAFGMATGFLVAYYNQDINTLLTITTSVIGASLPDIDLFSVKLTRKPIYRKYKYVLTLPLVGFVLSQSYKSLGVYIPAVVVSLLSPHRTFTHSILGLAIFTVSVQFFNPSLVMSFVLGYLSHLVLDSVTPMGVRWLYPFK